MLASCADVADRWLLQEQTQHTGMAEAYAIMGQVCQAQGRYESALEQLGKCLAIYIKALGEDHPSVAMTYNNIAMVYDKQGKHEMALELYEKGLAIRIKALGEEIGRASCRERV